MGVVADPVDLLSAYERYRTSAPGEAMAQAASQLSPHRMVVARDHADFSAWGRFADAGSVTVCRMGYNSEVWIDRPGQERYVPIMMPAAGHLDVMHQGEWHPITPGQRMLVMKPERRARVRWSPGAEALVLLVEPRALESALASFVPHAGNRPLQLDERGVALPFGSAVYGAACLLAEVLSHYDSVSEVPPRILHALVDQALHAVLLGVDHSHSEEIRRAGEDRRVASVRPALDLVESEVCATYSISDLALECGVTVRALEVRFRKSLGMTPQAYLQRRRLENAHRELQAAGGEGVTVTEVATRWGFWHVGRFAARYRARYGQTPSQTLRRVRGPEAAIG